LASDPVAPRYSAHPGEAIRNGGRILAFPLKVIHKTSPGASGEGAARSLSQNGFDESER
jgi:hypothetical protein